ncbi:hypothetical protein Pan44_42700 [Caulifigura coniformis]|uniref:Uncharacterized protein n=1 Tax=Caulifigura coniformis TaxID=2527983 RepID=A0A517SJB9_9PLAN|nr:hypothetical protein [Caulifigura coniformis]QDT56218.1 hypothetical protein Pan44_42700 [Caulifigura coniformis]
MTPRPRAGGRRLLGASLASVMAFSGCGLTSRMTAPNKLQEVASANPLPPAFSQPPVEPIPAPVAIAHAPPATLPPPPLQVPVPESPPANDEVTQLKAELAALKTQQEQSQKALESLTNSSLAAANRSAAIEAHLALQSSLIDDLRTATQQQQREQWKALDAVSEGIDRMLRTSGQEPVRQADPPPPASPPHQTPAPHDTPGDIPLQEILSRQPGETTERKLR